MRIVIYLDFHSRKQALYLVSSRSRAPDQIQMYRVVDARAPNTTVCLFVFAV